MVLVVQLNGKRLLQRLIEGGFGKVNRALGALAGGNVLGHVDRHEVERGVDQLHVQILIRYVRDGELHLVADLLSELGDIKLVRLDDHREGGVGSAYDLSDYADVFRRRTFVCLNSRGLGNPAGVTFCTENNLKLCAVTDSKLLLSQRSLGASSARHHFLDLQGVVTDRVKPESVRNMGVLGSIAEVE